MINRIPSTLCGLAGLFSLTLPLDAAAEDCFDAEVIAAADTDWHGTSWFDINNSGDMVGNFCAEDSECELWDAQVDGAIYDAATGEIEVFSAPDGYNVVQTASMNESGVVVGTAVAGDGTGGVAGATAFRYEDGESTAIDDPMGVGYAGATDINANGDIVGYSACPDSSCARIGWLLDTKGDVTEIAVDGSSRTIPYGINSRGDIAGYFYDGIGAREAFILPKKGEIEILTDFWTDYREYQVLGMDNHRTLVGDFVEYDPNTFAVVDQGGFIWVEDEDLQTTNVLDYTDTKFTGINESGDISATADGQNEGLLVTQASCD